MAELDNDGRTKAVARPSSNMELVYLAPAMTGGPRRISVTFPTGHVTEGHLVILKDVSWWDLGEYEMPDFPGDTPTLEDLQTVYAHEFPEPISIKLKRPEHGHLRLVELSIRIRRGQPVLEVWIVIHHDSWRHVVAPKRFIEVFTETMRTKAPLVENEKVMEDHGLLDWQWVFFLDPRKTLGPQARDIVDTFERQWDKAWYELWTGAAMKNRDDEEKSVIPFDRTRMRAVIVSLLTGKWNGDWAALLLTIGFFVATGALFALGLAADILQVIG